MYENLYPEKEKEIKKPKFKVGDRVRITKMKGKFEKGYTTRWRREIFVIDEVLNTDPVTYKIKDLKVKKLKVVFMNKNYKILNFRL